MAKIDPFAYRATRQAPAGTTIQLRTAPSVVSKPKRKLTFKNTVLEAPKNIKTIFKRAAQPDAGIVANTVTEIPSSAKRLFDKALNTFTPGLKPLIKGLKTGDFAEYNTAFSNSQFVKDNKDLRDVTTKMRSGIALTPEDKKKFGAGSLNIALTFDASDALKGPGKKFVNEAKEKVIPLIEDFVNKRGNQGATVMMADQLANKTPTMSRGIVETVTDVADVQKIKNSIDEGELILQSGKTSTGRKMEPEELQSVQRTVDNARAKIGDVPPKVPTTEPPVPAKAPEYHNIQEKADQVTARAKQFKSWNEFVKTSIKGSGAKNPLFDSVNDAVQFARAYAKDPSLDPKKATTVLNKLFVDAKGGPIKKTTVVRTPEALEESIGKMEIQARMAQETLDELGDAGRSVYQSRKRMKEGQFTDDSFKGKKGGKRNEKLEKLAEYFGYDRWDESSDLANKVSSSYERALKTRDDLTDQIRVSKLELGKTNKKIQADAQEMLTQIKNGNLRTRTSRSGDEVLEYKERGVWKGADDETALNKVRGRQVVPDAEALPMTGSKGEIRSIEIQEQAARRISQDLPVGKTPSLAKIITQDVKEASKKINIFDYLRTPEKVLTKIGFAKEGKLLRKGYDDYIKELPKNIDKITAWAKSVPAKSNIRIFSYLDGEAVTLTDKEQKVADEIKSWLKDWAKRLNLPEDNTLSHYITHIFDDQLISKDFDEDLAKIIENKLPGQVYDPFLQKRLGKRGYKQDTWAALDAYVKRATRKVHMDPALESIKHKAGSELELSNIETSQWKYLKRYMNGINMRPTEIDSAIDNFIKDKIGYRFGARPFTRMTKKLRQWTFRGMLGFNPGSALRNLSQGINTYAVLGEKYTTIGYAKLMNRGNWREMTEQGIFDQGFIQDRALSATKKAMEKLDKGLFIFFDSAEKINRGAAYLGAKAKGLSKGMSEQEAIDYAKDIVRKTQFSFGSIDTPVGLQSDVVKTLTQFQTYTIKQVEFLNDMVKDKNFMGLFRYGLAGLVFTYTIGKAFGMEPKQILPSFRFDTPPSLKFPVAVVKALPGVEPNDKYGNKRTAGDKIKDIGSASLGLIPAGTQMKKTFTGLKAVKEDGTYTKSGKKKFDQDDSMIGRLRTILFGPNSSKEAKAYFNKEPAKSTVEKGSDPFAARSQKQKSSRIADPFAERAKNR